VPALVRAQSLRGYRELVNELGGNPPRLLRTAGIDPTALNQVTALISCESLIRLLERSATDLHCPDFGLRLADRQGIGILGTLAVAMRYSGTVGEAMGNAAKCLHINEAAIAFTIAVDECINSEPGQARLTFEVPDRRARNWGQTAEHGIGLAARLMTMLSEGRCHLRQVWLPHPAVASDETYRSHFEAPTMFGADGLGLAYDAEDLDLPISEHHQELHDLITRYLDDHVRRERTLFAIRVRQTIEALLGTGTCGHRQVAAAMYVHPRTLQRRLREENRTFEDIKDEVRRDLTQRYLSHRDVQVAQVSALLDYSEPSAFGRSCQRWFHTTPRTVRAQLLSDTAVPSLV
jgi:AraC-like DNA-binding protein